MNTKAIHSLCLNVFSLYAEAQGNKQKGLAFLTPFLIHT